MADITTNVNTKSSRSMFRNKRTVDVSRSYTDHKTGEIKTITKVINYDSKRSASDVASGFSSIFSILLLVLLLVNFYKVMYAGDNFEFTGTTLFLETLANAKSIDITPLATASSWSLDVPVIGTLVNFLKDVVLTVAYIGAGLVQIISYIVYFVGAFLV